jgi:hypothetical protein
MQIAKHPECQVVTQKSAQAPNERDSQLASFRRKTARILRVVSESSSFCVPSLASSVASRFASLAFLFFSLSSIARLVRNRSSAEWLRRKVSSAFRQFYASGGGFFSDSLGLIAVPNSDSRDFSSSNERQNRHRPADDPRSHRFILLKRWNERFPITLPTIPGLRAQDKLAVPPAVHLRARRTTKNLWDSRNWHPVLRSKHRSQS